MYRGSSFLLRKDYTIHIGAVKIILDTKYNPLNGIECEDLEINIELLMELSERLENYYLGIKKTLSKRVNSNGISDTLITKILLGTLGCSPAYDQYFKRGIITENIASGNYSKKSIKSIINYYRQNNSDLEKLRKNFNIGNMQYPQMKIIDMIFWKIGK